MPRQLVAEPGATYTETGTLNCPFPEPELAIAQAVLLCWPEADAGYQVESAPSPEGPWNPVDTTLFVEDEKWCASVPASDGSQFFRLVQP